MDEFDRHGLNSKEVHEIRRRTILVDDESVGWVGSSGTVHLTDGSQIDVAVVAARGSLDCPLSESELKEKFFSQVEPVFQNGTSHLWDILSDSESDSLTGAMLKLNAAQVQ